MVALGFGEIFAYKDIELITLMSSLGFIWCFLNILNEHNYITLKRMLLFVIIASVGMLIMQYKTFDYQKISGNRLVGVIDNVNQTDNGLAVYLDTKGGCQVLLYYRGDKELYPGLVISCEAEEIEFEGCRNEGGFNDRRYYYSIGIKARYQTEYVEIIEKKRGISEHLYNFKIDVSKVISHIYSGKNAEIIRAMIIGDKSGIDDETKSLYQDGGIIHLLAISGTHIAIIGLGIYKLLRKKMKFLMAGGLSIAVIMAYGIMIGEAVSVKRAIIMLSVKFIADILGRTYDMISAISLSGILLLVSNPYVIFNSAFLLSFGAVIAIATIYPVLIEMYSVENPVLKSAMLSISIQIATLPIICNAYYEVAVYSVVANLIILPFVCYIIISSMFAVATGYICIRMGVFLAGFSNSIIELFEFVCHRIVSIPGSKYVTGTVSVKRIIVYYGIIFIYFYAYNKRRRNDRKFWEQNWYIRYGRIGLCAFVSLLLCLTVIYDKGDNFFVSMIDVGQGDSTLIKTSKTSYLIDAGSSSINNVGKYRVINVLKANGLNKLDYLILTHMDADHINGADAILNEKIGLKSYVGTLVLPDIKERDKNYKKLENLAKENDIPVFYICSGYCFKGKDYSFRCIYPVRGADSESINELSVVMDLEYKDFSMLFMGDLGKDGENELLKSGSLHKVNAIKVGHHGSKNSSGKEFLSIINPEISFISAGEGNMYGHPSNETLDRLKNINSNIFCTIDYGEVKLYEDSDGKIRIRK